MKKFSEIQHGVLNHIFQKLSTLEKLENQITHFLPEELRPFCRIANFENGVLVFAVKNSLWGTKLKFRIPELLQHLRSAGLPQLASIRYYIEPEFDKLFCPNQ